MNYKLLIVTHNLHKFREISAILPENISLISLNDIHFEEEIAETCSTLEGNAHLKARLIYDKYKIDCFADDTGLEVESLHGNPGVYSARYAGLGHDFEKNIDKLLTELKGFSNRKARFRTVICLILDNNEYYFEGIVNGQILTERRGKSGFGYDPVFLPDGYLCSFAEMILEEKNKISHRAEAINKMVEFLQKIQH